MIRDPYIRDPHVGNDLDVHFAGGISPLTKTSKTTYASERVTEFSGAAKWRVYLLYCSNPLHENGPFTVLLFHRPFQPMRRSHDRGILIGDGQINYRPEKILETFYAMKLINGVILTFDYQFITNLAHNADRGPISIFTARLHGEF